MTTTVDYNVDPAIGKLNKLNQKVQEAGKKAKNSFGKGGKASQAFGKTLDKIPGKAGSVVSGIRGIASAVGPMAAGIAVAAGSVASVVAQFIDFNEIMKDSLKTIEGFKQATKTIQDSREAISALFDAEINRNIELAKRAVKLDQADNSARQRALEEEIEIGKRSLDAFKDELEQRQNALRDAINKEQDLRKRLADRQDRGVTEFAGFDPDLRAAKLNQEARQAAERGDIDRAEALEREAQAVAENAKNRAFAAADAQKTADVINSGLEEEIDKAASARKELEGQVKQQELVTTALEETIKREQTRLNILKRQGRELAEQQKILRVRGREAIESQTADTAARTVERGARDFLYNIRFGDQSGFEVLKNLPSELGKFVTDRGDQVAIRELAEQAGKPAQELGTLLQRLIDRPGSVTGQDIQGQVGNLEALTNLVAELQAQRGRGELSAGSEQFLTRLEKLLSSVRQEVFGGAAKFIEVREAGVGIQQGTQPASREDMNRIRETLLNQVPQRIGQEVSKALNQQSRATAATESQKPASQGSPAPTQTAAASNINVTANVKGGIIDAEVTREITRIIKQELRKQTSSAPVA